jgi:threonine synthase
LGNDRVAAVVHQGRVAQPDQFVQSQRTVGGGHQGQYLGAKTIALPTAGNAGNAAAAYSAAAGLGCEVFIPKDAKRPFVDECRLYGANVTLVDGLITDAGRMAAEKGKPLGWYDVSTLKEPYRIEGKKTMAYELAEQMDGSGPTGSSIPPAAAPAWSACGRRSTRSSASAGSRRQRPRMVSVQAEDCAPIVRAFDSGTRRRSRGKARRPIADGLRVPRAIGDFLILRAVRESGGTALAVSDPAMIDGMLELGARKASAPRPKAGAALAAIERLVPTASIKPHESVVALQHRRRAEVSGCPEAGVARAAVGEPRRTRRKKRVRSGWRERLQPGRPPHAWALGDLNADSAGSASAIA